MQVGLHHHREQRLIDPPAPFEQRREERAGAQLGDLQLQIPGGGGQRAGAVPVALVGAFRGTLVQGGADGVGELGLDQRLIAVRAGATPRPVVRVGPWRCRSGVSRCWRSTATGGELLATRRGERWADRDLVFATEASTAMDAANVRRDFQRVAVAAGLDDRRWSPRELRHSFVSLLSDGGVPIEEIARLIGHTGGSKVTESVYRKQLRPVIEEGATAMNRAFPGRRRDSYSASYPTPPRTPRRPGQDPQLGR